MEWISPDRSTVATWRWGGELWMSGPEWGYLSLRGNVEIKGALPEVAWSPDSSMMAFIKLHDEAVPNRQGSEGFSFRIGIVRTSDLKVRYCHGNARLTNVSIAAVSPKAVTLNLDGQDKVIDLQKIQWN